MSHIIYENQEAIFTFEYEDIYQELIQTIRKDKFHDILMFFKWLQDNSERGEHDIRIQSDDMYQQENYLNRISYVIKALFSDQKGIIHCKKCNQTISASKIHKEQASLSQWAQGEEPANFNKGPETDGHRKVAQLNIGRIKFLCDKGHIVFGIIDWQ